MKTFLLSSLLLAFVTTACSRPSPRPEPPVAPAEAKPEPAKTKPEPNELDKISLCHDGKSHYVGLLPHPRQLHQVFFGDGKTFQRVRMPPWPLGGKWFFEPREYNPQARRNWRGSDLRVHSQLEVKREKNFCQLSCGKRKMQLELLDQKSTQQLLAATTIAEPLPRRKPFALARDRKGTYYLVDTDDRPEARDFRVFRGPKGNLAPLKMVNIVFDSKGKIFSTKSGELRLVLEEEHSFWITGKQSQQLINVPIQDNLPLIYNELGVYLNMPLGTPCDIF